MSVYFKHDGFTGGKENFRHGFFGSQGGVSRGIYASLNCGLGTDDEPESIEANRKTALEALGLEKTKLYGVHQIHSNECILVQDGEPLQKPEADALVTDQTGLTLSILTADCAPILLQGQKDNGAPVIGAAHAGWKGALSGILEGTVKSMIDLGAQKEGIKAVIGPTIGPQSYEVGAEFKKAFLNKDLVYAQFFQRENNSIYFDLPSFCESCLKKVGVAEIYMKNLDTFFHEEDFFSYRRATHRKDKDYGRQISMISIV